MLAAAVWVYCPHCHDCVEVPSAANDGKVIWDDSDLRWHAGKEITCAIRPGLRGCGKTFTLTLPKGRIDVGLVL